MNRLQEIEQRLAAIRTECMNEGADLDALTTEANSLVEERRALLNQQNDSAERRRALLAAIANGTAGAMPPPGPRRRAATPTPTRARNTATHFLRTFRAAT